MKVCGAVNVMIELPFAHCMQYHMMHPLQALASQLAREDPAGSADLSYFKALLKPLADDHFHSHGDVVLWGKS